MKIIDIEYPVPMENILDIENDNIDVFIQYDNGVTMVITVVTPKSYSSLMEKTGRPYVGPGSPDLIVEKLTKDIIEEAIYAYAEYDDSYYLKLLSLSCDFTHEKLNEMLEEITRQNWKIVNAK